MCRIDDCDDRSTVHSETKSRARKEYKCEECRRVITKGEPYLRVFSVTDGGAHCMKVCAHCSIAQQWLYENCGGYIYGEVREEIEDHAREYPTLAWPLYRVAAGMRRKWGARAGGLMPLPKEPPIIKSTL